MKNLPRGGKGWRKVMDTQSVPGYYWFRVKDGRREWRVWNPRTHRWDAKTDTRDRLTNGDYVNPRRASGHIPGTVLEIRYDREGKPYYHTFKPGVRQRLNRDGSVTLYHPSRRIWADDREPKFWERYGHGRQRGNPSGGGMSKTMKYVLFGLAAYIVLTKIGTASSVGLPGGIGTSDVNR